MARDVADATREVADAVHDLRYALRPPEPPEVRGYQSYPRRPDALALAVRLCVDRATGDSLARYVRPVPASHLQAGRVRCLCGMEPQAVGRLSECWGGCGRLFCADEAGVWSIRLPRAEA